MFEVLIDSIRVSLMNYQRVVVLKEKDSDRYLPIWIGPTEADAIALKLQDVSVPRPLTHDLLGDMIVSLGGEISRIVVYDLAKDTFYAKIVVSLGDSYREVDCRPSDALAVAVRANVPIFVEELVMEQAGIGVDADGGSLEAENSPRTSGRSKSRRKAVSSDELERMSAFKDFIQNLPGLEDLDNEGQSGSRPDTF